MHPDAPLDWWWIALILVGALVSVCWQLILTLFRGGSTANPLPILDRVPRSATVVGRELAPRRRSGGGRGASRLPGDLWLIEVEYRDAEGTLRQESLADLIHDVDVHRFRNGTTWQVYGFEKPRAEARRCLLTEAHDDVPRSGYNLDGVRVRGAERQVWRARRGSPFFGVMAFRNDATWYSEPITGRRTSWPGDPGRIWAESGGKTVDIARPHPAPVLESVKQASQWMDPSPFPQAEAYVAPLFWVLIPVVVIGVLAYGTISHPAGFDAGQHWDLWLICIGVLIWLLITIGVVVHRVRFYPRRRRESAEQVFEHSIVCEVHRSPYYFDGGEGTSTPGRILIDHSVPDAQAARIVGALRAWVSQEDVEQELGYGTLHEYRCIASEEIFGPDAAGGYFTASAAEEGGWVLLTETREDVSNGDEPAWRQAGFTIIPTPERGHPNTLPA